MFWRKKMQQANPQPSSTPKPASKAPGARSKLSLLSLESRLMFDAAAAATAAEVNQEQVAQEQAESAVSAEGSSEPTAAEQESQELLQAISTFMPNESRTEVVFVDPTVPNYQELLSGMDPNIEVIMLDEGQDGMEQMASALSGRTGIEVIHIISHGSEGQLTLGTGTLSQETMTSQYADELATIQQSLSAQADILVYGCKFVEGQVGQEAATLLSQLNGADVAASSDATGIDVAATPTRHEIAFVDTQVGDYQSLVADLQAQSASGTVIEVVLLDAGRDGIEQIGEVLAGRQGVDAVHVLSHGVDGALELGNAWLNGYSLEARADEIAQWSNALSANADIVLYGCDVAATGQGQAFINRLAEITGADIAASQDATGSAALGGNWNLEYSTGSIEAESAIDAETQQDWAEVMAITTGLTSSSATASGASASSLTWSHTVESGSNGILIVNVSLYTNSGITVSSVTYGGVALTQIGAATSSKDHAEMWYLKVPVTGTANVVVTLTGSTSIAAGATNFFRCRPDHVVWIAHHGERQRRSIPRRCICDRRACGRCGRRP